MRSIKRPQRPAKPKKEPTPESIAQGARVAKRREELGISQGKLAKLIGIKQPSLSDIESGKTFALRGETLAGICTHLVTTTDYILGKMSPGISSEVGAGEMEAELTATLRKLTHDRRIELLNFARYLAEQQRKTGGDIAANGTNGAGIHELVRRPRMKK